MQRGADRCPYERPFAVDFDECPAYQPVRYVPMDLNHRPMQAVWTCAHLESARGEHGGFFPRCRLGDAEGRREWVSRIAADRLRAWQEIARDFGEQLSVPLGALMAAKSRQVEHFGRPGPELRAADAELREAIDRFLEADFAMMDARSAELEAIGFPAEPMKVVTAAAMEDLVLRPSFTAGWDPPEALLAPFSADIRDFIRGLFAGPSAGEERG